MKRRKGFSFVEVLFAVFLVAMSASIVVATMPIANKSRAKADYNNKATGLAEKQLEAIRGLGYSNCTPTALLTNGMIDSVTPISTNTYSFTNSDTTALDNPARILPTGTGKVLIEQPDLDLRRVIVTISWVERGATRTVTVGTLIANL